MGKNVLSLIRYAVDHNPCPSCKLGEYCEKEEHCDIQPTNHGQINPGGLSDSDGSDGTEGSNSTYRDGSEEEDLTQSPTKDEDEVEDEIFLQEPTLIISHRRRFSSQIQRRSTTLPSGRIDTRITEIQDYLDSKL